MALFWYIYDFVYLRGLVYEMSYEDHIGALFTDRGRFILFDGPDSCTHLFVYESLKLCTDMCVCVCVCVHVSKVVLFHFLLLDYIIVTATLHVFKLLWIAHTQFLSS